MTQEQQQDSAPVQAVDTPVTPEATQPTEPVEGQTEQVAESDEQRNARLMQEREARQRKRNDSVQRRIDELTAEKYRLMGVVEQLSGQGKPAAAKPASDPEERPSRESFESYEDYLRADARWEARQEIKQAEQTRSQRFAAMQAQRQAAELARRLESDVNKAKAELPDYDDVVSNLDFEAPPSMVQAILSADSPARVFHALGKAPDEARRIASLDPLSQIKAIAKIEAALSRPAPQVSKAPPPGKPVGTSSSTGEKDPSDMSYDEFVKYRRRQIAQRR